MVVNANENKKEIKDNGMKGKPRVKEAPRRKWMREPNPAPLAAVFGFDVVDFVHPHNARFCIHINSASSTRRGSGRRIVRRFRALLYCFFVRWEGPMQCSVRQTEPAATHSSQSGCWL